MRPSKIILVFLVLLTACNPQPNLGGGDASLKLHPADYEAEQCWNTTWRQQYYTLFEKFQAEPKIKNIQASDRVLVGDIIKSIEACLVPARKAYSAAYGTSALHYNDPDVTRFLFAKNMKLREMIRQSFLQYRNGKLSRAGLLKKHALIKPINAEISSVYLLQALTNNLENRRLEAVTEAQKAVDSARAYNPAAVSRNREIEELKKKVVELENEVSSKKKYVPRSDIPGGYTYE